MESRDDSDYWRDGQSDDEEDLPRRRWQPSRRRQEEEESRSQQEQSTRDEFSEDFTQELGHRIRRLEQDRRNNYRPEFRHHTLLQEINRRRNATSPSQNLPRIRDRREEYNLLNELFPPTRNGQNRWAEYDSLPPNILDLIEDVIVASRSYQRNSNGPARAEESYSRSRGGNDEPYPRPPSVECVIRLQHPFDVPELPDPASRREQPQDGDAAGDHEQRWRAPQDQYDSYDSQAEDYYSGSRSPSYSQAEDYHSGSRSPSSHGSYDDVDGPDLMGISLEPSSSREAAEATAQRDLPRAQVGPERSLFRREAEGINPFVVEENLRRAMPLRPSNGPFVPRPVGADKAFDARMKFLMAHKTESQTTIGNELRRYCPILGHPEMRNLVGEEFSVKHVLGPFASGKSLGIPAEYASCMRRFKAIFACRSKMAAAAAFHTCRKMSRHTPIRPFLDGSAECSDAPPNMMYSTYASACRDVALVEKNGEEAQVSVVFMENYDGDSYQETALIYACAFYRVPLVIFGDIKIDFVEHAIGFVMQAAGQSEQDFRRLNCLEVMPPGQFHFSRKFICTAGDYEEFGEEEFNRIRNQRETVRLEQHGNEREICEETIKAIKAIFAGNIPKNFGNAQKGVLVIAPSHKMIKDIREAVTKERLSDVTIRILHKNALDFSAVKGNLLVLSTDKAEDGINITGLTHVVDTCLTRFYHTVSPIGMNPRWNELIDGRKAGRRAGRVGRTKNGFVVYPFKKDFVKRIIQCSVTRARCYDIDEGHYALDFHLYRRISDIDASAVTKSCGAMNFLMEDHNGWRLFRFGEWYQTSGLRFLNSPRLAKLILSGMIIGCAEEAVTLAALLSQIHSIPGMFGRARTPAIVLYAENLAREADFFTAHKLLLEVYARSKTDAAAMGLIGEDLKANTARLVEKITKKLSLLGFSMPQRRRVHRNAIVVAIAMAFGDRAAQPIFGNEIKLKTGLLEMKAPSAYHVCEGSKKVMESRNPDLQVVAVYNEIDVRVLEPTKLSAICSFIPLYLYLSVGNIGTASRVEINNSSSIRPYMFNDLHDQLNTRLARDIRNRAEEDWGRACEYFSPVSRETNLQINGSWIQDALDLYSDFHNAVDYYRSQGN